MCIAAPDAEDADNGFLPSPGKVRALSVPGGPGVRDDSGVRAGSGIPSFYDSMISKLIVWGADRGDAMRRLGRVLEEYRIAGVKTTLPFFRWLLDQPEFAAFVDADAKRLIPVIRTIGRLDEK